MGTSIGAESCQLLSGFFRMRASRLLSILLVLQARGRVSAESLARELEVSVRTVYRDIDELGAAGVPVYAERGRNGGFGLLDGYRANLTDFSANEADAVPLIGMAQAAADLGLGTDANAARQKILAGLPARSGGLARRIAARIHLDPVPWYSREAPPPALRELAGAVWADRQIRATYRSWKGEARRLLSPLGLVMKAGTWYLVAGAHGVPRTYRVSNLAAVEILDSCTQRPRSFDLPAFWSDATRDFESALRSGAARVRLSPAGVKLLADWNPAASAAVASQSATQPDGWIEARIPMEPLPHAAREVLRLGAEIEVLEPLDLRNAVEKAAREIARLNRPLRGR
jgi:predicted DNA-binding transcriptional regulator YafY